ncbi:MAG: cytochrome P450, partial [Chloroflexi bacterium]|nr:cytochrome P450 [Chloroflexota bacterium]
MTDLPSSAGPHRVDHRYAPPERWTLICRPGDPHRTLVDESGALLYDYVPLAARPHGPPIDRFGRVVRFGLASDERPSEVEQFTDDPGVPIVTTILRYSQCALELLACGHTDSAGRRLDVVRWRLSRSQDAPAVPAAVRIEIVGEGGPFGPPGFEPGSSVMALDRAGRPTSSGPVMMADTLLEPAPPAGPGSASAVRTALEVIPADAPTAGAVALMLDGPPMDASRLRPGWVEETFRTERRFWAGVALQAIELRVPDRRLMDLLTAAARTIAQRRGIHDGPTGSVVGGDTHRDPSILDGFSLMEAASYLGLADQARKTLEGVLRRAQPDGASATDAGHLWKRAVAVAAVVRHHELHGTLRLPSRETDFLGQALERMGQLRQQGGNDGMPRAFEDGGLQGERPGSPALYWTLAALSIVGRAACVPVDLQARADQLSEALRGPRARQGSNPAAVTYALVHAVYPGEVFGADDPVLDELCRQLDTMDDEEGIPAGTGRLGSKAVWTSAASSYAHVWLYSGRPAKAIDYLYAFANHAAPTGVWREEQSLESSGECLRYGDMPHDWASAEFVRLVRDLLVFERGDELELLAGLPPGWLRPGAQLVVERTPTRFGPVSLRASLDDDAHELALELDGEWVRPPERIVIRPPARAIDVRVDGHAVAGWQSGLTLPVVAKATVSFALRQEHQTITGHAAVKAAVRDWPALSSASPFKPDIRGYRQLPIEADPPDHSEYRAILTPIFDRQRVAALEPSIRAIAADLVAGLASTGRADAVHDLALPLVVRSLAVALGRPQDADEWLSWGLRNNEPHGRRDSRRTDAYVARVLDEVERRPGTDVFSRIASATIRGRPLSRLEKLGFGDLILSAGRAAAVNLVCGAIWHLASQPAERARLAADHSFLPAALDEWLRYLSPVPMMPRVATGMVATDPADGRVELSFLGANHDPTVFSDPERIDLSRRPNHHLAFGNGPHTCIGAHLGKLEARAFVEELLRVVPDFRPDGDPELEWNS